MSQNNKRMILLIDYENIQTIDFSNLEVKELDIKIFVGKNQTKIPIELVQSTQRMGDRVQWIKIEESGNNALDFHIAFYLGQFSQQCGKGCFIVLSKDKGFDPLINHMKSKKISCRRVQCLSELTKVKGNVTAQSLDPLVKVITYLSKLQKIKRPKSRQTIHQYMKALLTKDKISEKEIATLIDRLLIEKKISEVNEKIVYNF